MKELTTATSALKNTTPIEALLVCRIALLVVVLALEVMIVVEFLYDS